MRRRGSGLRELTPWYLAMVYFGHSSDNANDPRTSPPAIMLARLKYRPRLRACVAADDDGDRDVVDASGCDPCDLPRLYWGIPSFNANDPQTAPPAIVRARAVHRVPLDVVFGGVT